MSVSRKGFPQDILVIAFTYRSYNCIIPPGTTYTNDRTPKVSYLISCDKFDALVKHVIN